MKQPMAPAWNEFASWRQYTAGLLRLDEETVNVVLNGYRRAANLTDATEQGADPHCPE